MTESAFNKYTIGNCGDEKKDYDKLRREIKEKLGVDFLPGFPPWEVAEKEGIVYIRGSWEAGRSFNDKSIADKSIVYDSYYRTLSDYIDDNNALPPKDGVVMCPCGNKSFYIEYGGYECIGICSQCGTSHSLYSG